MSVKWLVILPAITTIIIHCVCAELRELSISDGSSVCERTMKKILDSCYDGDSLSDPIVVVGDFNEFTDQLPMIRINNFKNLRPDTLFDFKLTTVIIVIDHLHELEANIESLKKMSWWNHMASFFIIVKNTPMSYTIFDDHRILSITTIMNMINSIYIFPVSMNTSILYTVNEYANYAPHPWETVRGFGRGACFSQRVKENVSCSSLHYDRTLNLDKIWMKVAMWEFQDKYSGPDGHHYLRADGVDVGMFLSVSEALNIGHSLYFLRGKHMALEALSNGEMDLICFQNSIEEFPTIKSLFPHSQNRIFAVIKSSLKNSTQHKILPLWSIFGILLAFITLSFVFFILSWRNHEASSALLVSSLLTNIKSNSFRIFFTITLIMIIISNGVFQGKMASLLITREEGKAIKRIDTLVQLGYKFYSTPELELLIQSHCIECNAMIVETDECFKRVLEGEFTACLIEESVYQHIAFLPFDVVEEPLLQTLMVTKCRDDWPLYERFNNMWIRAFESGLRNFLEIKNILKSLLELRVQHTERSSTQYQPLKLYEVLFAFEFLAIGLSLSTLVFIAELLVKKYRLSLRRLPILWRWL